MSLDTTDLVPELLDHGVVGVLMGHIEGAVDWASVWVFVVGWEQLVLVERPVLVVDSIVEGDDDHLGNLLGVHPAWDEGSIGAAEAVWESAVAVVARWSCIWIVLWVAPATFSISNSNSSTSSSASA